MLSMLGQRALLTRLWRTPTYRTFLLLMVLMSLATSAGIPLIALYLVRDLSLALSLAGLFFTGQALPGLALGLLLGRRSDAWATRLPFIRRATAWVGAGWLVLALSPFPWLSLCTGALFLSLGGVLMGQLYAALYDVMTRDGEAQPQRVTTTIRTAWSFGFVFGPLLGSALATVVGIRAAFLVAAALYLLCLVPLQRLTIAVPAQHDRGAEDSAPSTSRAPRLLLAFTALCALVLCGQTFRNAYLPLHITTHLGGSMAAVSTLMAISPVVELVTLPLAGALADRVGLSWLIGTGLAIATVEYVIVAASTAVWQLYLTQALDACVVAVVLGLGLTYAQRLSPQRPGLASSLLFSAFNLSGIVGGLLGSVAVPLLGVPRLFLAPAGLCAICAIAFVGIERVGQAGPKERHRGAVATAAPLREATRR